MKKIGWQKYEDYIEKQIHSPILSNILNSIISSSKNISEENDNDDEDEEDEDDYIDQLDDDKKVNPIAPFLPITNKFVDDILMLSSFDCWIGHTNFDITPEIKDILNSIPGVELLKICSRYRFFIGIGQMFDFKNVRQDIEDSLI